MASHDDNGRAPAPSSSTNPAGSFRRGAPEDPARERAEAQFRAFQEQAGEAEIALDVCRRNGVGHLKTLMRIGPPMPGQGLRAWVAHLFGGGRFLVNVFSGELKIGTLQFDILDVPAKPPPPGGWLRLAELDYEATILHDPAAPPPPVQPSPFAALPWWSDPEKILNFVGKLTERQAAHDEALVRAVISTRSPNEPIEDDEEDEPDFLEAVTKRVKKRIADRMLGELDEIGGGRGRVIDVDDDEDDDDASPDDPEWGWLRDSIGKPVAEAIGEEFAEAVRKRRNGSPAAEAEPSNGQPERNAKGERVYTEAEAREIYRRRRAAAEAAAKAAEAAEAAGDEPEIIKPEKKTNGRTRATRRPRG